MVTNALYFPYINVPDTDWLYRMLLYWDRVCSIVPRVYVDGRNELKPHMQHLIGEGLVQPIMPQDYIREIPNFESSFLQYIDDRIKYINASDRAVLIWRKLENQPLQLLHMEKVTGIVEELQIRGLALPTYPWVAVHMWVADAYMAYLATCLGRLETIDADPVTESITSFNLFRDRVNTHPKIEYRKRRFETRQIIIENILPAPR
jgi:hypothetical protein